MGLTLPAKFVVRGFGAWLLLTTFYAGKGALGFRRFNISHHKDIMRLAMNLQKPHKPPQSKQTRPPQPCGGGE